MGSTVGAAWRKATYSSGNGGNCVEVGRTPGSVLVRDTVNRQGVTLPVSPGAWGRLLEGIRSGDVNPVL